MAIPPAYGGNPTRTAEEVPRTVSLERLDRLGTGAYDATTFLRGDGTWAVPISHSYVMEGSSASAGQASLSVAMGGGASMSDATLGIPVPVDMTSSTVAVAWRSGTAPSGDWTATLWRRTAGGAFTAVATFDFQTS